MTKHQIRKTMRGHAQAARLYLSISGEFQQLGDLQNAINSADRAALEVRRARDVLLAAQRAQGGV